VKLVTIVVISGIAIGAVLIAVGVAYILRSRKGREPIRLEVWRKAK
jgi:hypothetical protein